MSPTPKFLLDCLNQVSMLTKRHLFLPSSHLISNHQIPCLLRTKFSWQETTSYQKAASTRSQKLYSFWKHKNAVKFDTHTLSKGKKKYNFLLASHPRTTIADFLKFYIIYYLFGFQDFKKFIYRYKIIFLIFLYILKKNNFFFLSPPSHQHTCSFIRGSQSPNTISAQMLR